MKNEAAANDLEAILRQIQAQADAENIRITQHAQQEMVEENITLDEVIERLKGDNRRMKCSIEGCLGEYEEKKIFHTVRHRGQVIVIDHVPAEVCSVCGDVLLKPETVRRIEALLRTTPCPVSMIPLYEYV